MIGLVLQGSTKDATEIIEVTLVPHDDNMEGDDMTRFLKAMRENMETFTIEIKKEIKTGNDNLEDQIKASRIEMKKELLGMNRIIEEVRNDANETKAENEKFKNNIMKENDKNRERLERMESRMTKFDKENRKQREEENKREMIEKETDRNKEKNYVKAAAVQPAGRMDDDNKTEKTEEIIFKSNWARQMSQVNLEKQLQLATEAAARMEDKGETEWRTVKSNLKVNKLGNSLDRHDAEDWGWGESDKEWEGTMDRASRNKEKKEREIKNLKKKIEKAALIGRCTIGIGPIQQRSVNYFHKITGDYNEAKKMAAAEYLQEYLRFDQKDLSDLDITDTRTSAKGDNILYIVLDCPQKVINIRKRIADVQHPDVKSRDYIPPQFFERYAALSRYAADLRKEEVLTKTQIRFMERDICLFTKEKGTEEPFRPVNMEELIEKIGLPNIDYKADWKMRNENPPWRRTSPAARKITLKSLEGSEGGQTGEAGGSKTARRKDIGGMNLSSSSSERERQPKTKNQRLSKAESSPEKMSESSSSSDESPAKRNTDARSRKQSSL